MPSNTLTALFDPTSTQLLALVECHAGRFTRLVSDRAHRAASEEMLSLWERGLPLAQCLPAEGASKHRYSHESVRTDDPAFFVSLRSWAVAHQYICVEIPHERLSEVKALLALPLSAKELLGFFQALRDANDPKDLHAIQLFLQHTTSTAQVS